MPVSDRHLVGAGEIHSARVQRVIRFDRSAIARAIKSHEQAEGNDVRTVMVENASRFARELIVQELGIPLLDKQQVPLLTASGSD
jgi:hypothetical protein